MYNVWKLESEKTNFYSDWLNEIADDAIAGDRKSQFFKKNME